MMAETFRRTFTENRRTVTVRRHEAPHACAVDADRTRMVCTYRVGGEIRARVHRAVR